jgi:outer membrane protein TolC
MRIVAALTFAFVLLIKSGISWADEPLCLKLEEALARVTAGGRDILMARQAAGRAKDEADMATAQLRPQVTAIGAGTYLAYQPAAVSGTQTLFTSEKAFPSLEVNVYQPLYHFGAMQARQKAALALSGAADDSAVAARNVAVLQVIEAYFDALEADRILMAARHELVSLARHARDVSIFYREGVVTQNDLLTVALRFNTARQALVEGKSRQGVAAAHLRRLLSLTANGPVVTEEPEIHVPDGFSVATALAAAQRLRPELHAMHKALTAAGLNEKAADAEDKPEFFADGGYKYADNRYQSRNDNWRATVGVRLSVFNGGLIRAEKSRAGHEKGRMIEAERKLEEEIRFQVEKDHFDMVNARQREILGRTAVRQAQENARVAEARFIEGAGTSSEVLDALVMRAGAETALWQSRYASRRAYARLLYDMGIDVAQKYLVKGDVL